MADDAVVGPGQVITDPASETEPAPEDVAEIEDTSGSVTEDSEDGPAPQRGELHVLGSAARKSSPPAPAAAAGTSAKTLPFTGVNAGLVALSGLALLAAGSGLLTVLRQPVE